jgi:hypothetical protein
MLYIEHLQATHQIIFQELDGFGPKTILKTFPELLDNIEFTLDDLQEKCNTEIQLK